MNLEKAELQILMSSFWQLPGVAGREEPQTQKTMEDMSDVKQFCAVLHKALTSCLHFTNISYDEDKLFMLSLVTDPKDIPPDRKLQANIQDWISDWKTQ